MDFDSSHLLPPHTISMEKFDSVNGKSFCEMTNDSSKRRKLMPEESNNKNNIMSNCNNTIEAKNIFVKAILEDGVGETLHTSLVSVLVIKEKRFISKAVKELAFKAPVPSLTHLKRVRKIERNMGDLIVLYYNLLNLSDREFDFDDTNFLPLNKMDSDYLLKDLHARAIDLSLFEENLYVSKVSKYPPKIRTLYDLAQPLWPCSFHEDAYLTRLMSPGFFDEDELQVIAKLMGEALRMEEEQRQQEQEETAGPRPSLPGLSRCSRSCVIGDASGGVVGRGVARTRTHPLQHAPMLAVDDVAHALGGGGWERTSPSGGVDDRSASDKLPRELLVAPLNQESSSSPLPPAAPGSYICTGLDVFLPQEPCMMCAMALLHSRVRRVFYAAPNASHGALGSRTKLHCLPGVNHRYEVFVVGRKGG